MTDKVGGTTDRTRHATHARRGAGLLLAAALVALLAASAAAAAPAGSTTPAAAPAPITTPAPTPAPTVAAPVEDAAPADGAPGGGFSPVRLPR